MAMENWNTKPTIETDATNIKATCPLLFSWKSTDTLNLLQPIIWFHTHLLYFSSPVVTPGECKKWALTHNKLTTASYRSLIPTKRDGERISPHFRKSRQTIIWYLLQLVLLVSVILKDDIMIVIEWSSWYSSTYQYTSLQAENAIGFSLLDTWKM